MLHAAPQVSCLLISSNLSAADLGTATCAAGNCPVATDVTFKEHIVRLGLNYRF